MKIVNFGSMNLDHVYAVPHFVKGGETLAADSMKDCVGGKGLNQSLAVARSGASIYHAGMLGDGGELLRDCLEKSGVDVSLIERCDAPQGHTAIQVTPDGQNCILVFGGSKVHIDGTGLIIYNDGSDRAVLDSVFSLFIEADAAAVAESDLAGELVRNSCEVCVGTVAVHVNELVVTADGGDRSVRVGGFGVEYVGTVNRQICTGEADVVCGSDGEGVVIGGNMWYPLYAAHRCVWRNICEVSLNWPPLPGRSFL